MNGNLATLTPPTMPVDVGELLDRLAADWRPPGQAGTRVEWTRRVRSQALHQWRSIEADALRAGLPSLDWHAVLQERALIAGIDASLADLAAGQRCGELARGIRSGAPNFVVLCALEHAEPNTRAWLEAVLGDPELRQDDIYVGLLLAHLSHSGAIDRARRVRAAHVARLTARLRAAIAWDLRPSPDLTLGSL